MQPGNQGQDPYGQQPPYGGQQPPQYGEPQPQYGQPQYGQPQYGQPGQYPPGPEYGQGGYGGPGGYGPPPSGQVSNTMGLISMILGIVSIPLACCGGIGVLVGIPAAILGHLGRKKADQGLATNRGQAVAGFICGLVGIGLGIITVILNYTVDFPTRP
jgi:hypothetical protein